MPEQFPCLEDLPSDALLVLLAEESEGNSLELFAAVSNRA